MRERLWCFAQVFGLARAAQRLLSRGRASQMPPNMFAPNTHAEQQLYRSAADEKDALYVVHL